MATWRRKMPRATATGSARAKSVWADAARVSACFPRSCAICWRAARVFTAGWRGWKSCLAATARRPACRRSSRALSRPSGSKAPSALHVILKALVEAGEPPAAIHQLLLAARPGWMGGGVDVERELAVGLPPGGAGPVGRAVVQGDGDEVIIGV